MQNDGGTRRPPIEKGSRRVDFPLEEFIEETKVEETMNHTAMRSLISF